MSLTRSLRLDLHPGVVLVGIMHLVGLVGMISPYGEFFVRLTPLNLIVSGALLLFYHKDWNREFLRAGIFVYAFGFGIEYIGVQTGLIFGEYAYGSTLGYKVGGVPLLIGLNWLLLSYCAVSVLRKFEVSSLVKAFIGASMLTLLDLLIEPVAIRFDMWQWESESVPVSNYLAWFVISFLMVYVLQRNLPERRNVLAPVLLIVQFVFFGILNFV